MLKTNSEFLTTTEAAEYLGVSIHWIYKLTAKKLIRFYKPSIRKIFFLKKDLDNFVFANPVATEKEVEQKAVDRLIKNTR